LTIEPKVVPVGPQGPPKLLRSPTGQLAVIAEEAAQNDTPLSIENWNFEAEMLGLDELRLNEAPSLGDALIYKLASIEEGHHISRRLEGDAVPLEVPATRDLRACRQRPMSPIQLHNAVPIFRWG
jgi:hypothetical protein